MKKRWYLLCLVLVLLVVGVAIHRTTLRFITASGASIRTDQPVRLAKVPFSLHVQGYKLQRIQYNRRSHLLLAKYEVAKDPLSQVQEAKYLGVTFQPTTVPIVNGSQQDPFILSRSYDNGQASGRDTLRILIGNQYGKFRVLSANYPAINVRDPSIMKQGKTYYIIYTRGLLSTADFRSWKQHRWSAISEFEFSQDWAPEFVSGPNQERFVVMSAQRKESSYHQLYTTTFRKGEIGTDWKRITGNLPENTIDPDIQYANGRYYLVCKDERTRRLLLGSSKSLTGPYHMKKVRLDGLKYEAVEGPEMLIHDGKIKLMFDTYNNDPAIFYGLHYIEGDLDGSKWSRVKTIQSPIVTRHGQVILN
ncbi:MAG: family 43 glycosylhydrolase [Limosilactobacillus oris]|uniref:family 43 glycosylhydrolase n=1 Tax=Limosilactobacillus oris TaxID=1632 RepID=UPI00242A6017|nr:family 43 glycosylhydrolase [Limosilactobacillus oris]MCH3910244.1 family 43 glycosylhydrolase [Limosilactobacillus oris]MCH3939371.1 family 43 glycosylhydrolase [Limosilactobacillus oris]MCI2043105.1 family 43 glycosylhydrolase [Limosilactobacillus oris]